MANEHTSTSLVATLPPIPEDDFEKITVLLPKDTIQKLDTMARTALLGSRGRAIQALVDAIADSAPDIGQSLVQGRRLQELSTSFRPGIGPTLAVVQQQLASLNALMFNMSAIITRLNKFLGIRLVEPPAPAARRG